MKIAFCLLLLLTAAPLISANPHMCKAALISGGTFTYGHTWVQFSTSCSGASPGDGTGCYQSPPYTTWSAIGFERSNGGSLRNENALPNGAYACTYWDSNYPAVTSASDSLGRQGIAALVSAGWSTAPYSLLTGVNGLLGCPSSWLTPYPSSSGNVCWRFTCAFAAEMNNINRENKDDALRSITSAPAAWTCDPAKFGSGDGVCDCGCGAWDPDCEAFDVNAADCGTETDICVPSLPASCLPRAKVLSERKRVLQIMGANPYSPAYIPSHGNYTAQPEVPAPASWTCPKEYFASDDGCDCRCGAWDPDCDKSQEVNNCEEQGESICEKDDAAGSTCQPVLLASSSEETEMIRDSDNHFPVYGVVASVVGGLIFVAIVVAVFVARRRGLIRRNLVELQPVYHNLE